MSFGRVKQHTGGAPEKHTLDGAARRGRTLAAVMSVKLGSHVFSYTLQRIDSTYFTALV